MPLISIILPVYNGETYLAQTIESILAQTYQNFELIVVYDISTDNSLGVINDFCRKDRRITLVHNNLGGRLPGALNAGFANASGDYYTWWSDDNIMYPTLIEKMVDFLNHNPEYGIVTCNYINIDCDNNYMNDTFLDTEKSILCSNNFSLLFLYRKEVAEKTGIYNTEQFLVEDYDYFIRMSLITKRFNISEILGKVRVHDNSLTTQHQKTIRQKDSELKHHYLSQFKPMFNNDDYCKVLIKIYQYHPNTLIKYRAFLLCVTLFPHKIIALLCKKLLRVFD